MGCSGLPSACDLRTLLVIERSAEAADGRGGRAKTWSEHRKVWAAVAEGGGSEGGYGGGRRSTADYTVTIRYDDVTAKDRVLYEGETYNIISVHDIKMRRQWLKLAIRRGEPE